YQTYEFPYFLADGRHFLFASREGPASDPRSRAIYVRSTDGGPAKKLIDADSAGIYLAAGFLLYMRDNTLLMRRFDSQRQVTSGEPTTVLADPIGRVGRLNAGGAFSVSMDGKLAYRPLGSEGRHQLTWFDRNGKRLGDVGEPNSAPFL